MNALANQEHIERIRSDTSRLIRRSDSGVFQLIRREGWIAVPVESSCHFSSSDAARLAEAYAIAGEKLLCAVALEDLLQMPSVFEVETSKADLLDFSHECASFNYSLVPYSLSSVVVCTTDDYFVLAGESDFVRVALGRPEAEALESFRQFAETLESVPALRAALVAVYRAFAFEYPSMSPGSALHF